MVNQIGREHRARLCSAQRMDGYSSDLVEIEMLFRMVNWQSITVAFGISVCVESHSHLTALLNELATEQGISARIESAIIADRGCFRGRLSLRYGEVLYCEALLRQVHREPTTSAPSDAIQALEHLGLARELGAHVLTKVLDQLEADSSIFFGANISARSAILDHWWLEIERRLKGRPDLARRLIIEITETVGISPVHAVAFVDHMRGLGCRIALDDFGTGFASIRELLALPLDIVKIPSFFVRQAPMSKRGEKIFMHIIGLARALTPLVVVEGVETDDQCKLTESAGAPWLQGYRSGCPTMGRPSVQQPDSHKMWALLRFRDAEAARSADRVIV